MFIFYTPDIKDNIFSFDEQESKHCIKVLRKTKGDLVQLVDGRGGFFTAKIIEDNFKKCIVEIVDRKITENHFSHINIAIAPTKNIDRIEWFLEKSTEIGINSIYLFKSKNSERNNVNIDRLEKILISAMKQSCQAYKPKMYDLLNYSELLKNTSGFKGKYIAYCAEEFEKKHLRDSFNSDENNIVLIGPEGDFTKDEVSLAINSGFKTVSLGENRLRTETAALVSCAILNFYK